LIWASFARFWLVLVMIPWSPAYLRTGWSKIASIGVNWLCTMWFLHLPAGHPGLVLIVVSGFQMRKGSTQCLVRPRLVMGIHSFQPLSISECKSQGRPDLRDSEKRPHHWQKSYKATFQRKAHTPHKCFDNITHGHELWNTESTMETLENNLFTYQSNQVVAVLIN
jgi:hypothetical protein